MAVPECGPTPVTPGALRSAIAGTVLGFDFGARRIGVAVGETATAIASPLGAIAQATNDARFQAIAKLVAEWKPVAFVVGRPRHADGAEHPVARLAQKFARRLAARHALPVVFVDETLSSATAEAQLRDTATRRTSRGDVDALAAALILQSFLDEPDAHERLAP